MSDWVVRTKCTRWSTTPLDTQLLPRRDRMVTDHPQQSFGASMARSLNPALAILALVATAIGTSIIAPPVFGQGSPAPACKRWEITVWSPAEEESPCDPKGQLPYRHRGEWCSAPVGAEIIDAVNVSVGESSTDAFKFWVKRCAE